MLLHVVSAAAPVAATAGHWVWEKSNSAVSRVSFFHFLPFQFYRKKRFRNKKDHCVVRHFICEKLYDLLST
jgi:hypothetical protein